MTQEEKKEEPNTVGLTTENHQWLKTFHEKNIFLEKSSMRLFWNSCTNQEDPLLLLQENLKRNELRDFLLTTR